MKNQDYMVLPGLTYPDAWRFILSILMPTRAYTTFNGCQSSGDLLSDSIVILYKCKAVKRSAFWNGLAKYFLEKPWDYWRKTCSSKEPKPRSRTVHFFRWTDEHLLNNLELSMWFAHLIWKCREQTGLSQNSRSRERHKIILWYIYIYKYIHTHLLLLIRPVPR